MEHVLAHTIHKRTIAALAAVAIVIASAAAWNIVTRRDAGRNQLEQLLIQAADAASVDYFLKIDGVDGESSDEGHKDEIEILSFSWGETGPGVATGGSSAGRGGGGGAGKATFNDIHFTKSVDKASPVLMLGTATGQHYPQATMKVRKAGSDRLEYMTITLTDVMITSYSAGGHQGTVPTDSFSLNYSKIEFEYIPQNPDGSAGAPVKAGYDLKLNKKV